MDIVKALVIEVGKPSRIELTHPADIHTIVGGWLEVIGGVFEDEPWHAYCHEEGKLIGLPINLLATTLARKLGWRAGPDVLVGTVVFLGSDAAGGERNVPVSVVVTAGVLEDREASR